MHKVGLPCEPRMKKTRMKYSYLLLMDFRPEECTGGDQTLSHLAQPFATLYCEDWVQLIEGK